MDPVKRQDEYKLIAALLHDIHMSHEVVFNMRSLKLTLNKLALRLRYEGIGFLTKTLPRMGKAVDSALSEKTCINAAELGFKPLPGSKLPRFLGEFFMRVFTPSGTVLHEPCAESVRVIRQVCFWFYKYELPYTAEQEQKVLDRFKQTEEELVEHAPVLTAIAAGVDEAMKRRRTRPCTDVVDIAREARILLSRVFSGLDLTNIIPRHGPGAVATRQRLWGKYLWDNVSSRVRGVFPLDAFFYASLGHVADSYPSITKIDDKDLPARVCLVPKDSRGPRLISCEPVEFQWIQQGIMRRLVQHLESIRLTKFNVFFTDQGPSQRGAILGSLRGKYSTLDLNEASDRISFGLVRLLFPEHVFRVLEAARSLATELPNGEIMWLQKFAPMGSAICFPTLALTIWALLTAGAPDTDTRESILVYGDDVIVPTVYAENAMNILESFGLRINRDKSCTKGFFRESCGVDAFKGIDVTPLRLRTVWSSLPSPDVYTSWIAYANLAYDRHYFHVYDLIVAMLHRVYGEVPEDTLDLGVPSLREVPEYMRPRRWRTNHSLQKREWRVRDVRAKPVRKTLNGWLMLLRFFTEAESKTSIEDPRDELVMGGDKPPFSVRSYTRRNTNKFVMRWR